MKTPEERAAEIVGPLERSTWPVDDGWPDIAKEIADAIREAFAEEREACAAICDRIQAEGDKRAYATADPAEGSDGASRSARLIRARS